MDTGIPVNEDKEVRVDINKKEKRKEKKRKEKKRKRKRKRKKKKKEKEKKRGQPLGFLSQQLWAFHCQRADRFLGAPRWSSAGGFFSCVWRNFLPDPRYTDHNENALTSSVEKRKLSETNKKEREREKEPRRCTQRLLTRVKLK